MKNRFPYGILILAAALCVWLLRRRIFPKYASFLGKKELTRGLRNNNPGNIRLVARNDWKGRIDPGKNTDGAFEQFRELRFGTAALIKLLTRYINQRGAKTIRGIISMWAPPSENDTARYISAVSARLGVSPDAQLRADERTLKALAKVIALKETGRELTEDELRWGWQLID